MENNKIDVIHSVLDDIGLPMHYNGYNYIAKLIELKIDEPDAKIMQMYKRVAAELGVKYGAIERSVRHAIHVLLENAEASNIHKYFGNSYFLTGIITNKQFVYTLAFRCNKILGGNNA